MVALVAGRYLATNGPGRLLLLAASLRPGSFQERLGLSCALGTVVLGWVGYVAAVAHAPWLATRAGWVAIASGIVMLVLGTRQGREACDLDNRDRLVLGLAVLVGLGFAAAMNYWQIHYQDDGSLTGRFVWPDLLYRNAVLNSLLNCNGHPD